MKSRDARAEKDRMNVEPDLVYHACLEKRLRKFAAAHAETIVVNAKGIEAMKAYRADVHNHMAAAGRSPSDCKILFLINPILGETEEDALERRKHRQRIADQHIEQRRRHLERRRSERSRVQACRRAACCGLARTPRAAPPEPIRSLRDS